MKKITLSLIVIVFAVPTFADNEPTYDINAGANSVNCVSDTLHATSGNVNLNANWSANNVDITFLSDGTEFDTGSCTYDGTLTLPDDDPEKTGYTFGGWRVKSSKFDLTTLSSYISEKSGAWSGNYVTWKPLDGLSYSVAEALNDNDLHGGTDRSAVLNNGDWSVIFSYGTVKGRATCSSRPGNHNNYRWNNDNTNWKVAADAMADGYYNNTDARYCWCKPTGFDANSDGTYVTVLQNSWVYREDYVSYGGASGCAKYCAYNCAYGLSYSNSNYFRAAVYGLIQ